MTATDTAAIASAVFAGFSALVAAAAIYFPWRQQQSQELLAQAVLSLQRAYEALSNAGKDVKPPLPDRLNWLTCARHIEGYKALKARLRTSLHRLLCEEHEEFWRHQFYLCLDIPSIHSPSYYAEQPPPNRRPGIEPRSALIVYAFARWPEGKPDPIDAVDIKALMREYQPLKGNIGLREYIKTFSQFRDET
jgi:hypothetical protein